MRNAAQEANLNTLFTPFAEHSKAKKKSKIGAKRTSWVNPIQLGTPGQAIAAFIALAERINQSLRPIIVGEVRSKLALSGSHGKPQGS